MKKPNNKKDLEKKHPEQKVYYVSIAYQKGDLIDQILNRLCNVMGLQKSAITKNAILSYNLFINQSLREQRSLDKEKK